MGGFWGCLISASGPDVSLSGVLSGFVKMCGQWGHFSLV